MVPKVTSAPRKNVTKEKYEEVPEGSPSDEEQMSGDESIDDSIDYNDNNDFLQAIEATSSKRKLDSEKESNSDEDTKEVGEDGQHAPKKKKKKKKPNITNTKPPTAEEMTRLRETENLFHSNLFRMQIEEMIKEVRPKKMERNQMKSWLEELKEWLLNVNIDENIPLNDRCYTNGVRNPLPRLPFEEVKGMSTFHRPESVSVIGSYTCGSYLGPSLTVDVAVIMPKKCFLKEDFLNARYHKKRAAYLGLLAQALQVNDLIDRSQGVRWVVPDGDLLSPRLVLNPANKLSSVTVILTAIPHPDCFKLTRFAPNKNNIKESWIYEGEIEDCHYDTPIYNTSVMKDLVMMSNETVRQKALENNNNVKDAITLLRVWLKQRNLDVGSGSFSGYLVSMLVTGLLLTRRLNNLMSSYQIVRNVWLVLSQSDWTNEGFTLCSAKHDSNTPSVKDFHHHFDVVFVDTTGYCNLAAYMDRLTYFRVKNEAKLAVQCLDNPDMNSFQALFMTPVPFLRQFDHVISIKKNKAHVSTTLRKECSPEERINYFGSPDTLFTRLVSGLLVRGLGDRVTEIGYKLQPVLQWPVGTKRQHPDPTLLMGIRLNAESAYSVVEKGPPANEPEAAEFRKLWGNRCELRRFRDGMVCEAVVWAEPSAPLATRRLITKQMVLDLLHSRLELKTKCITYLADQLEPLVTEKAFVPEGLQYGAGEEAALAVIQAFDRLAKQLRELPDLPLEVAGVQGLSAVCRGAEVFPPLARTGRPQAKAGMEGPTCWLLNTKLGKAPEYIDQIEGVIQLGLSRKWPEDLEAVRRIRAAFNLTIAKALKEKFDLQTQAFPDYFDIFKDGYVFRIRVVYPREVVLLKESTTPDGKLCYRDTPESLQLEKLILHLPKLNAALHGVQQQWPGCGVTWRLAKRWLSSQLIDNYHFPDVATELLVASLFLFPEPFRPLEQPQPMFLRFLNLLAHTNWQLEPIIVNFNGDLKRDDLTEIESYFRSERASLPPLFIATPYDKSGCVWTREAPLLPVLLRVSHLATEALNILESKFFGSALLDECKVIFRPPMELYDAVIHLKPMLLPRTVHAIDFKTNTPLQLKIPQVCKKIPITGFDPAQLYLQELREGYGEYALFFHDTYGGVTIGVLFKPLAFEKQEFKVSQVNCRKLIQDNKKTCLTLNFEAIIEDLYILGTGLVKSIDLSPKYSKEV